MLDLKQVQNESNAAVSYKASTRVAPSSQYEYLYSGLRALAEVKPQFLRLAQSVFVSHA